MQGTDCHLGQKGETIADDPSDQKELGSRSERPTPVANCQDTNRDEAKQHGHHWHSCNSRGKPKGQLAQSHPQQGQANFNDKVAQYGERKKKRKRKRKRKEKERKKKNKISFFPSPASLMADDEYGELPANLLEMNIWRALVIYGEQVVRDEPENRQCAMMVARLLAHWDHEMLAACSPHERLIILRAVKHARDTAIQQNDRLVAQSLVLIVVNDFNLSDKDG